MYKCVCIYKQLIYKTENKEKKRKESEAQIILQNFSNVELHIRLALGKLMTMKKGNHCTL